MTTRLRCVVVGAGAWGLPAATELARRGHHVTLIDRHGIGNPLSSSAGPSRLWRLTHPDAVRVRLAQRSVDAWARLCRDSGETVFLRRGLLWRDDESLPAVRTALSETGVEHTLVAADDVGRFFPGLRPDGREAVWQVDAGPVLASVALAAQERLLVGAGGTIEVGPVARLIEPTVGGVAVHDEDGGRWEGDVVVLAAGPGSEPLLAGLGVDLTLQPHLEQVVHFGARSAPNRHDDLPCLYDGPAADEPGIYAMPTPGRGYKVGMDRPLRDWSEDDRDRTPDTRLVGQLTRRVGRDLSHVEASPLDAQVCSWTDSPDGRFVIDVLPPGVVVACGDSGEGFKFSALMGLLLADLAEGRAPDPDLATFGLSRFAAGQVATTHVLGR